MFLRVSLSLIGKGSFTSEEDKLGLQSVTVGSSLANNMSVVTTPKDLNGTDPSPTIRATESSLRIYTPITIPDLSKVGYITVRITARANYRSGLYSDGKYRIGDDRNLSVTRTFTIKMRY